MPCNSMKKTRMQCAGFEFDCEVIWTDWKPGIKYVKHINVHNLSPCASEVQHSLPSTGQFQTIYPKPRKVASGAQFRLPVTFTPTAVKPYEDSITFEIRKTERFVVHLRAVLPDYAIAVPQKLDFGAVAINDSKSQIFTIRNLSTLETDYVLHIQPPFYVNLPEGILAPFEKRMIELTFQPKEPGFFNMEIHFDYGPLSKHTVTMSLYGKAEYPKLAVHVPRSTDRNDPQLISLRFPSTASGSISEKILTIENPSQVNATARVEPVSTEVGFTNDHVFRVDLTKTIVQPGQRIEIPVRYQPRETGRDNVGYFKIITSDAFGECLIKCCGQSPSVNVETSVNHLVFDIVELGKYDQRVMHIRNLCELPTTYQLVINASGAQESAGQNENFTATVFPVLEGKTTGILQGREEIRVVLGFLPPRAGHYYRQLALLVSNQAPIFIDLLGTCHDLNEQPHYLTMQHLNKQAPERSTDPQSVGYTPSGQELLNQQAFEQYARLKNVFETVIEPPSVSIDPAYLDFTSSPEAVQQAIRCAQHQIDTERLGLPPQDHGASYGLTCSVVVQNHTTDVMFVRWTPLRVVPPILKRKPCETQIEDNRTINEYVNRPMQVFFIEPMECELAAGKSSKFVINFVPNRLDQFFHFEFEGFASYKIQRDCSLCSPDSIRPPHCLSISCFGHTFPPSKQPFMPEFGLDRSNIHCPSMGAGETRFKTLCVKNESVHPLLIEQTPRETEYSNNGDNNSTLCNVQLIPPIVQVPPKSEFMLALQCDTWSRSKDTSTPVRETKLLRLLINKRPEYELALPVLIDMVQAAVELEDNGELHFPPAQLGARVVRQFAVRNLTSFSTRFQWKLLSQDREELQVVPETGLLKPNEIQYHTWTFHARKACQCVFTAKFYFGRAELSDQSQVLCKPTGQVTLRLIAMAVPVTLQMEPSTVNCATIRIGTHSSVQLKLRNPCPASTYFTLTCHVTLNEEDVSNAFYPHADTPQKITNYEDLISLLPSSGWLVGHSSLPVLLDFKPQLAGSYHIQLYYQLWSEHPNKQTDDDATPSTLTEPIPTALLIWNAVYPTLRITDIAGSGQLDTFGAVELWRDLGLDNVNVSLSGKPTWNELKDPIACRSIYRDHPEAKQPRGPTHDIFIAAGTTPDQTVLYDSTVHMLVENTSLVIARFAFLFPEHVHDKLPNWAESGEYSDEELHHMYVQNNRLFEIHPRKAELKPGEHVQITITYNHRMTGANHLPVLWKIDGGREIQLNLLGITLPLHQPYLHFAQRRHVFPAVPLSTGDSRLGFLFRMQLRNPSARTVQYQLAPLMWPDDSEHPNRLLRENAEQPVALGGCEYDMPVLCCSNGIGVVPPNGFGYLEWRFRPLEAKTYSALCPIRIQDSLSETTSDEKDSARDRYNDTILLELTAIAYDSRQLGEQQVPAHPQRVRMPTAKVRHAIMSNEEPNAESLPTENTPRRLTLPESWVQLSHHFLSLERVTLGSQVRRLFHLTHNLPLAERIEATPVPTYRFLFYTRLPEDMEALEIRPLVGRICPGESKQIEVTFTALGIPRFVDVELTCELRDEVLEQAYEEAMTVWQAECDRRRVEFTITDQESVDSLNGRTKESGIDTTMDPPKAPRPRLLHLTIGIEVVSHEELQRNWPQAWQKQFVDSTLFLNPTHTMAPVLFNSNRVNPIEQLCCVDVLTSIVSGLVHDPDFVQLIQQTACSEQNETGDGQLIPFYAQFPKEDEKARGSSLTTQVDSSNSFTPAEVSDRSVLASTDHAFGMTDHSMEINSWLTETKQQQQPHDWIITEIPNDPVDEDELCLNNPAFQSIVETTLAQMLRNILTEANEHEVELTSRFRAIALPPATLDQTSPDGTQKAAAACTMLN